MKKEQKYTKIKISMQRIFRFCEALSNGNFLNEAEKKPIPDDKSSASQRVK